MGAMLEFSRVDDSPEIEALQLLLTTHDKASIGEGHGRPVFEIGHLEDFATGRDLFGDILIDFRLLAEDIGHRDFLVAFR